MGRRRRAHRGAPRGPRALTRASRARCQGGISSRGVADPTIEAMGAERGADILLVEDNPDHAQFTLKALGDHKAVGRTFWVKDGQEALDYLHRRNQWADAARSPRPG